MGLVIMLTVVYALVQYSRYRKNAYRRDAVEQIESILQRKKKNEVYEINRLLKIIAIQVFGRRKVASLYGNEWFDFLRNSMPIANDLQEMDTEQLTKAIYNKKYEIEESECSAFVVFATLWLKKHDVKNV